MSRRVYTLSLLVLIGTLAAGCAADTTARSSWGTFQFKTDGVRSPCDAKPVDTRTPSVRKGFAPPLVRPVDPVVPVEPLSAAPAIRERSATDPSPVCCGPVEGVLAALGCAT